MSTEHNVTEEQIRSIVRDELENGTEQVADQIPFTRREILKGVSILGLGAAGAGLGTYGAVGKAAAQTSSGSGTIGTSDNPLEAIYVDQLYQNEDNITATTVDTERASITRRDEFEQGYTHPIGRLTNNGDYTHEPDPVVAPNGDVLSFLPRWNVTQYVQWHDSDAP